MDSTVGGSRVTSKIRRSHELVRACHRDLQHLIELRNAHLTSLEAQPHLLERVNYVIKTAKEGLAEASHIVERCRPGAQPSGKTPLLRRIEWLLSDSTEFRSQEPVICRHHAAVLAEVSFLRQMALWALPRKHETPQAGEENEEIPTDSLDNLRLLDEIMGAKSPLRAVSSQSFTLPRTSSSSQHLTDYTSLPESMFPNTRPDLSPNLERESRPLSSSWSLQSQHGTRVRGVMPSPDDNLGLSILLDDEAGTRRGEPCSPKTTPLNSSTLAISDSSSTHHPSASISSVSLVNDLPDVSIQQHAIRGRAKSDTPHEMEGDHGPDPGHLTFHSGAEPRKDQVFVANMRQNAAASRDHRSLPSQLRSSQSYFPPNLTPGPQCFTPGNNKTLNHSQTLWPDFAPFGYKYTLPEQGREPQSEQDSQPLNQVIPATKKTP